MLKEFKSPVFLKSFIIWLKDSRSLVNRLKASGGAGVFYVDFSLKIR